MTQPTPTEFFSGLKWIDGRPLLDTIEPYRMAIFNAVLAGNYTMALCGRAKKNWKTADLILAALYRLLAWQAPAGNDCLLLANDLDQAADDLNLASKIVRANKSLRVALVENKRQLVRRDRGGALTILPAGDAVGSHGKTYCFLGLDEIHGYRNYDVLEALAPDPTRTDVLTWITSYASLYGAGTPLHDLIKVGKRGADPNMYFSWYSADHCTDPEFASLQDGELKANPSIGSWPEGRAYLEAQKTRLPRHKYRRLHLNLPGLPEGAAFSADHVMDAIVPDRKRLEPVSGVEYFAGIDMSGGSNDDAVCAIAHRDDETGRAVLDVIEKQTGSPPFNPRHAVKKFADICKRYSVPRPRLDAYGGKTFPEDFKDLELSPELVGQTKYQIYEAIEPALNAGEAELLDNPTLQEQLLGLVWRGTKIDHQSGEHDDFANAACLALSLALGRNRSVSEEDMRVAVEANMRIGESSAFNDFQGNPWNL